MEPQDAPAEDHAFSPTEIGQLADYMTAQGNSTTSTDVTEVVDQANTSNKAKRTRLMLLRLLAWSLTA